MKINEIEKGKTYIFTDEIIKKEFGSYTYIPAGTPFRKNDEYSIMFAGTSGLKEVKIETGKESTFNFNMLECAHNQIVEEKEIKEVTANNIDEINISKDIKVVLKVKGETYSIKKEIKAAGGKWSGKYWYFESPNKNYDLEVEFERN